VGFVLAIVTVVFSVLTVILSHFLPMQVISSGMSTAVLGALFAVLGLVDLLLAATTAAFGIVGARRVGAPMLTSGIALGVGIPGVVVGIIGLIAPLLTSLAYNAA
jgi:hypothetical protein